MIIVKSMKFFVETKAYSHRGDGGIALST